MERQVFVIDIGTNSVRLMSADINKGRVFRRYKLTDTVRTGEGVHFTHNLSLAAMERTVQSIARFKNRIESENGKEIFCFATSAVRDAENRQELLNRIFDATGIHTEILDGEEEAACGFAGAIGNGEGALIDIGGGSTEIITGRSGRIETAKSFDIGCVRARDIYPDAEEKVYKWAKEYFLDYPFEKLTDLPLYAIGGTATSLAAISQQLSVYDPKKVDGYRLSVAETERLFNLLKPMSVEKRREVKGLSPTRAEIIVNGLAILNAFFCVSGKAEAIVRESDNLEGFLIRHMDDAPTLK